jgi:transcriptional regulator GlxA family with amidase domain
MQKNDFLHEKTDMVEKLAFIVYPGFQMLDLAGPLAAFEAAMDDHFMPRYSISVASAAGGLVQTSSGVLVKTNDLQATENAQTLIVCGGVGALSQADISLLQRLQLQVKLKKRLASICTGSFILAKAGVLKGLKATTHWRYASEFRRLYPEVTLEPDRIWIRDGEVWTSAGVTAGIDLSLALIEEDQGTKVARAIAGELVVYLRRAGGQSQYSALLDLASPKGRFSDLMVWAREHLSEKLTVEDMAFHAAMSARHFCRAFLKETGTTPAKAIRNLRLEVASEWVRRDTHSVSHIAKAVGFGSAERMRLAFMKAEGASPRKLRAR